MENNTRDSGQIPIVANQRHEIDFQQPPPYSVEPFIPEFVPGRYFDSNVPNSTLNSFNETLCNEDTFRLAPMGRLDLTGNVFVQLQNSAHQPIMSIKAVPPVQNISTGNEHSVRVGPLIQITNTMGQILITGKQIGEVCNNSETASSVPN